MEGYCRLDFMMKENGDMYCLEANTLPGMTPTSLIPQEAKVLGIDYPTLCEKLIEVSMKKYPTQDFTLQSVSAVIYRIVIDALLRELL